MATLERGGGGGPWSGRGVVEERKELLILPAGVREVEAVGNGEARDEEAGMTALTLSFE